MMTDPIADMLTRVRNALMVNKETVDMPHSNVKEGVSRVLRDEGFITDYRVAGEPPHKVLRIYLKYGPLGEQVIREVQRVSTPGRRIYRPVSELASFRNGLGVLVVSTNRGIMSDRECRRQRIGGEVICSVF
jgi:small subunit ribosomal protein S8